MLDKYSFMSLFCYCFVWVTSWKATFLWSESPRPVFFMKSIVLNSQHVGLTPRVLFYTSIFARFSANVAWTTRNVFLSLNSMRQMLYASNAGQKPSFTSGVKSFKSYAFSFFQVETRNNPQSSRCSWNLTFDRYFVDFSSPVHPWPFPGAASAAYGALAFSLLQGLWTKTTTTTTEVPWGVGRRSPENNGLMSTPD